MEPHQKRSHIGQRAEQLAAKYLEKQGLQIMERNFYCKSGEIDLIMLDRDYLAIVEVRCKNNKDGHNSALESITTTKQKKVKRATEFYLVKNRINYKYFVRYDVVTICGFENKKPTVDWIKNAYE